MTTVQQVLFECESPYAGHPYFVTGNAVCNGLAQQDGAPRESLCASHGVLLPGEYGEYPPESSQDGYAGKLGQSLPEVASYEDLFIFRDAAQRWLLQSRPRDAHNVLDVQTHGGRMAFAPECWFGRPPGQRNRRRSVSWYVQCYLHDEGGADVIPVSDDVLDGLRVGGARNYGCGELSLVDTQVIEVAALDYSRVRQADDLQLELLTPFVLASEDPGADGQSIPWWWEPKGRLRRRQARLVAGDDCYDLATIDHGQVVEYAGDRPVETAKNGIVRVGTHAKFGFGEFRVRPVDTDRVPERAAASEGRMVGESS
jgi:hypothetical protein